jgi:CMP-2-keto-3-deoxyoctulosonic acid synthetase
VEKTFEVVAFEDIDPLEDTRLMLQKTPSERIYLLEQLRSLWHGERPTAEQLQPGLQRFIEVVEGPSR